jgi:hypothetical protein
LDEEFGVERRLSQEVQLFKWADVAKVYCLDRTTTTRIYVSIIPVGTSRRHEGKLRIVLADGRQVVITKEVFGFSELANLILRSITAEQLMPYTRFVVEASGTLDFDKFRLSKEGLTFKRKLIDWGDVQRVSLTKRGALLFKTTKTWWSPRFPVETIPNATLLIEMLPLFGVQYLQEG